MARYFAILDGEPGAFGISFPDLPGCTAMGRDENEVYLNAIEALSEWVRDARDEGGAPELRLATAKASAEALADEVIALLERQGRIARL